MPSWHDAEINQAKEKKLDSSGRPCSHSFWKTTNLPWSWFVKIKSCLTMSIVSALLSQVRSQTLRLWFDSGSWHYSDCALRALLEIISNISRSATVRALPRRIVKASVSGPRLSGNVSEEQRPDSVLCNVGPGPEQ